MKENIKNLFFDELCSAYFTEECIYKKLPDFIKNCENNSLKETLTEHLEKVKHHTVRLDRIFDLISQKQKCSQNDSIDGLIKDCKQVVDKYPKSALRDAALIAKMQCIEHFKIANYGTLRTFATELEIDEASQLLQETLEEETQFDKILTKLAQGGLLTAGINEKANEEKP